MLPAPRRLPRWFSAPAARNSQRDNRNAVQRSCCDDSHREPPSSRRIPCREGGRGRNRLRYNGHIREGGLNRFEVVKEVEGLEEKGSRRLIGHLHVPHCMDLHQVQGERAGKGGGRRVGGWRRGGSCPLTSTSSSSFLTKALSGLLERPLKAPPPLPLTSTSLSSFLMKAMADSSTEEASLRGPRGTSFSSMRM